jgi:hypothetical protein
MNQNKFVINPLSLIKEGFDGMMLAFEDRFYMKGVKSLSPPINWVCGVKV